MTVIHSMPPTHMHHDRIMKMNKCVLTGVLSLALSGYSAISHALCTTVPPQRITVAFPDLVLAKDIPVNTVLHEFTDSTINAIGVAFNCGTGSVADATLWEAVNGFPLPQIGSTSPTNIPGIGLSVITERAFTQDGSIFRRRSALWCSRNPYQMCGPAFGPVTFQLIKTGDIATGGVLSIPGTFAISARQTRIVSGSQYAFATSQVSLAACSVSVPGPVDLGTVDKRKFPGPGVPYPDEAPFELELTGCDPRNIQIDLRLDGTTDTQPDVLALTRPNSGVGIQVLDKNTNTPITFNQDVNVGNTGGATTYKIPLAARYFQVGQQIVPGDAGANAQFTVIYK